MVLSFFCVRSFNFGWSPVYDCKAYYWDTCGSPVIKCRLFFSSATKWKNCAIVSSGHWALNTMTTNCDSMMCSHADHACYLDDDWRCRARTRPGHMTKHEIFVYKTLLSVLWYFKVYVLRSPGASWRKRSKYLQTHTQVVLFAANPHLKMLLSGNFGTDWVANTWKLWKPWMPCMPCMLSMLLS